MELFTPSSRQEWRDWLEQHHLSKDSICLVYYKKQTKVPSIIYAEAVDEALCFGWIDSVQRKLDEDRSMQYFSRRKPKSVWSKINKEKIQKLTERGLMKPAGIQSVEIAKKNGSWVILDEVEEFVVPADLKKVFKAAKGSETFFMGLSKSIRKAILQWIVMAKRPETRQKRIEEVANKCGKGMKPYNF